MTPPEWRIENSLSHSFGIAPTSENGNSLRFLREENRVEVYLDLLTGKEVYVGRTRDG